MKVINKRKGRLYVVKFTLYTEKGKENNYSFNQYTSFVNFYEDLPNSVAQLQRQMARKVRFFERMLRIKVIDWDYEVLYRQVVEFTPKPIPSDEYVKVSRESGQIVIRPLFPESYLHKLAEDTEQWIKRKGTKDE